MDYRKYSDGKLCPSFNFSVQFPMNSHYSWFQSLSDHLVSPDVAVISHHEDDRPTQYSFSSPHLGGLSPQDTLSRAKKLLALLSGAMLVREYIWMDEPLTLDEGWFWDEQKGQRVYTGQEPGDAKEFPAEINDFSYCEWPSSRPLSMEGKLLFLAHSDRATYAILAILGHYGITYQSLHSVFDCLVGAGGLDKKAVVRLGGVSMRVLDRFTATANNFAVLGVHARHGDMDWTIPKDPPLPLNESRQLIIAAAAKFLLARVQDNFERLWAGAGGPTFKAS